METQFKKLLVEGNFTELFRLMRQSVQAFGDKTLQETFDLVQVRWAYVISEDAKGLLTPEQKRVELLRISQSVLTIIDKLGTEPIERKDATTFSWRPIVVLTTLLGILALLVPCPTTIQYSVFRVFLSAAAAGFIALLPNTFMVFSRWFRIGGTVGVFLVVYLLDPARPSAIKRCGSAFSVPVYVRALHPGDTQAIQEEGEVVMELPEGEIKSTLNHDGEAIFKSIPADMANKRVRITLRHPQPYEIMKPDSTYLLLPEQAIYIKAKIKGLDKLYGNIVNESNMPMDSVRVSIMQVSTFTDRYGDFLLNIPEPIQQKFHVVECYKEGFEKYTRAYVPIHTPEEFKVTLIKIKK